MSSLPNFMCFFVSAGSSIRYHGDVLTRTHLDELPALTDPLHLALGFFDGVHLGHQAVIARAVAAAAGEG
ncbi:MAG: hypothetical protein K9N23_09225, partial [Akkermansiaceae bacterium]|nr:hypothetical protein [Akkermansiaceae bacterium]